MAEMYPKRLSTDTPDSERKAYAALQRLPDPWRVFYGTAWQSASEGESGDGEADFVLLHPVHGLIVLEVKGGGIDIERGTYFSTNRDGVRSVIKDPFKQAVRSKNVLLEYLKNCPGDTPYLALAHGVVFPDVSDIPGLGPEGPEEIIVDRRELKTIETALQRLLSRTTRKSHLDNRDVDRITRLLAPTETIAPLLRDDVAEANARLILLTDEQVKLLRHIRANRRALVLGGAGTGKTLLAKERALQLAGDGFRVLLTCFNRPLADFLVAAMADYPSVTVASFHQLCWSLTRKARLPLPPSEPDQEWYDAEAPDLLVSAAALAGFEVDAVVVDEGQDFAPKWWEALQQLMKDPSRSPFYIFADPHQAVYRRRADWEAPPVELVFELFRNCRNTLPIASCVAGIFGDELDTLGVPGRDPEIITVDSVAAPFEAGRKALVHLLQDQGLQPGQVVLLAASRDLVDRFRQLRVVDQPLVPLGNAGVVTETFHRFKGLEADVVIAVLPDLAAIKDDDRLEQARALAYIGLSRPRTYLIVIGTAATLADVGVVAPSGLGGSG